MLASFPSLPFDFVPLHCIALLGISCWLAAVGCQSLSHSVIQSKWEGGKWMDQWTHPMPCLALRVACASWSLPFPADEYPLNPPSGSLSLFSFPLPLNLHSSLLFTFTSLSHPFPSTLHSTFTTQLSHHLFHIPPNQLHFLYPTSDTLHLPHYDTFIHH